MYLRAVAVLVVVFELVLCTLLAIRLLDPSVLATLRSLIDPLWWNAYKYSYWDSRSVLASP